MTAALFAPLRGPALALASSLLGAYLAWSWFSGTALMPILVAGALILAAAGSQALGANLLPERPVDAVRFMNIMALAQIVLLAVAAAAAIIVTVTLAADKNASEETTQLLAAVVAAVTTFLTGAVVASDTTDDSIADIVQGRFQEAYGTLKPADNPGGERFKKVGKRCLLAEQEDGWNIVFSDGWKGLKGWGGPTRRKRARWLAAYLAGEATPAD